MRSKVPALTSVLLISSLSVGLAVQDLLTSLEKEVAKLIERAKPSVVSITSKSSREYVIVKDNGFMSLFREKREKRTVTYTNVGSGIIISKDGYIITKGSVVRGLQDIQVTLSDGRTFPAEFIDIDDETDLAVIKIEGKNLVPAKLGNSDAIKTGSWITIIGNSLGLSPAVSFGLVNGIRKDGLIQLSATISPGNSGCPIFNTKGEVVGIITARINAGDSLYWPGFCEGGLAYPANKVKEIADAIIKRGRIKKGWLGVTINHFREAGQDTIPHVTQIVPHGPAQRAGLREGDVIVQYNGKDIRNYRELIKMVEETSPNEEVEIRVLRKGQIVSIPVKIGEKPPREYYTTQGSWWITQEYYDRRDMRNINYNIPFNKSFLERRIQRLEKEIKTMKQWLREK